VTPITPVTPVNPNDLSQDQISETINNITTNTNLTGAEAAAAIGSFLSNNNIPIDQAAAAMGLTTAAAQNALAALANDTTPALDNGSFKGTTTAATNGDNPNTTYNPASAIGSTELGHETQMPSTGGVIDLGTVTIPTGNIPSLTGEYGLNDIYNFGGQDLGVNSGGYSNFGGGFERDAKGGLTGIAKLLHHYAAGGMPMMGHLGGYSDGGRLLRGPGDGISDSIPATIGARNLQPARLADGEFVVPARIVSELGNGSTEAGARKLYQMMDRVQNARKKTTGKKQVAANPRAEQYLPA
jgi:hypothetical protein